MTAKQEKALARAIEDYGPAGSKVFGVHALMYRDELEWLGRQAAERKTIIEVGSFVGGSTKLLALMTPGVVYSVDSGVGCPHDITQPGPEFDRNLAPELASGKVKKISATSVEGAGQFAPGFADMIYIDADHDHPAPYEDIQAWLPVVGDGLLCGHDADLHGVAEGLRLSNVRYEVPVGRMWARL